MILGESEEYGGIQAARGRGRGRAVRATVRQETNLTDTGNGTIMLILSFIILMILGESEENGGIQTARGRGKGRAVRATVRQGVDLTDTGNGTIILILSFIV